jgi:predicted transcriptional regulator
MAGGRSNRISDVGELQLEVLDILDRIGEGTVYDVLDQFPEADRPKYNTINTVLRTLEQKGLAVHHAVDRAFVYRPVVEPGHVRGRVLGDVVQRVFGGSPTSLFATLVDTQAVTPEVLRELRALLDAQEAPDDTP